MMYVDVILPLGYDGVFTYSVPKLLEKSVKEFVRVTVPLGKTKKYTGIIAKIHSNEKNINNKRKENGEEIEIKDILEVQDKEAILLPYQYRQWQWISDYYLCPLGDVFRAAIPAGMKQEDGYSAKTETYIRLTKPYRNEASLHVAINMLRKATKQLEALNTYLFLSHYDSMNGSETEEEVVETTREELTNSAKCSSSIIKALIDRGILEVYEVPVGRLNDSIAENRENIRPLSPSQQKAYEEILNNSSQQPVLLKGVTGSGKTEVYIHLIEKCIDEGKQVLYLLPEIALTVQITKRLQRVFGSRMGIYHSRYSDSERVEIWQKQLSENPYDVILGARSAIFLPFQRLGLIIIDEEHDTSFKQIDPAPRYHARSLALITATMLQNVKVVLGTATPSVETFFNVMSGKYRLVELTERYQGVQLPETKIIDIADLQRRKMMQGPFSPQLLSAIRSALENGKQVILFQNRRGFAPIIECHECGWIPKCKNCDVTLTMHKTAGVMTCHYCGFTYPIPPKCPSCFSDSIRERGFGTEKLEEYLSNLGFRNIARMDLDTTRTKNAYERIIKEFSEGKSQILIGTQMVTKGLDFANVSVVGIINADNILNMSDFRAYEYAFQMLCQVSGRAGRVGERGLVILQTRHSDEPIFKQIIKNDYNTFFQEQYEERRLYNYPPFTRIIYVFLRHSKEVFVENAALEMSGRLRTVFGSRILGPDRPSVARVKNQFIRKIVIKFEVGIDLKKAKEYLRKIKDEILSDKRYASMQIYYDVDPQ